MCHRVQDDSVARRQPVRAVGTSPVMLSQLVLSDGVPYCKLVILTNQL